MLSNDFLPFFLVWNGISKEKVLRLDLYETALVFLSVSLREEEYAGYPAFSGSANGTARPTPTDTIAYACCSLSVIQGEERRLRRASGCRDTGIPSPFF